MALLSTQRVASDPNESHDDAPNLPPSSECVRECVRARVTLNNRGQVRIENRGRPSESGALSEHQRLYVVVQWAEFATD